MHRFAKAQSALRRRRRSQDALPSLALPHRVIRRRFGARSAVPPVLVFMTLFSREETSMTEVVEQTAAATFTETDLVAAVRKVLQASPEPLTLSKIRSSLPSSFRNVSLEAMEESMSRQVSANVLHQFPKYRSQQNRYWDRPMRDHVIHLLRTTLEEKPLGLSELRRKLPDYAKTQAESVLQEQVVQGQLHQHPALNSRSGPRYGVRRPDPKEYLRTELSAAFDRLEKLGFSQNDLREGALELLHEEEWSLPQSQPATSPGETPAAQEQPQSPEATAPQQPAQAEASPRAEERQPEQPQQAAAPMGGSDLL
jgi:hypothetical protein